MLNKSTVIGRLGHDPRLAYTKGPEVKAVCSFSIACSKNWKDPDGTKKEKTTWFRVSVFGKAAEACNQYLAKGKLAYIEGEVSLHEFVRKDGSPGASLEILASQVLFLSPSENQPGISKDGPPPRDSRFGDSSGFAGENIPMGEPPEYTSDNIPF